MEKTFRLETDGIEVVLGKFADQADGAAWIKQGGTVVLSTVVSAPSKEFPGFLPLTVDYRELFSAAGKIPGGYFKREGKFTDKEVLTGRLIDRAIRPLFPANYFNQVMAFTSVYSVDKEHMPHGLALLGVSLALTISKIPFMGPVGFAEIARVEGQWIVNPTFPQSVKSDVKMIVAGTEEGVCMVEGSMNEISEAEFIDAMFKAHESIKRQVAWQKEIAQEWPITKEVIVDQFDWALWKTRVEEVLAKTDIAQYFNADKLARNNFHDALETEFLTLYAKDIEELGISETFLKFIFDDVWRSKITELSFTLNKRFDTRDFDTVRTISAEVGLLPFNHGSCLFQRGRTQALVSATLTGGADDLKYESLMDEGVENSNLLLHYNFHSFSVGEARPSRGPGRREIGHGYLAASAITQVLPSKEQFPYLIRIVSDILESDGSTSQATICGGIMSLMDAGVPIRKMVSGVAMGLLNNGNGQFKVLTDIAGAEDAYGLMDFKVAGTAEGIVAIQMDIKYKGGLKREVFETALEKARIGRLFILDEMKKVLAEPRPQLSEFVPRVVTLKVPKDKIGAIIGTGGKVIREIIEKTSTAIDIEDSGLVKVFGQPGPLLDQAIDWIKLLAGNIERGARYQGKIRRIADFGFIVELVPGVDGLVHISTIPRKDQEAAMKKYQLDDVVVVEITDYDQETGRVRLKLV
jgi:polyribonucleotide nucleotidyltransferase